MQIAHAGLQTLPAVTGLAPFAPSVWRSPYFRSKPVAMTEADIQVAIAEFGAAARRAQQAGFDGVQVHAAHGYLVHQFLSPRINRRRDAWGQDRFAFLRAIISAIKTACGASFPVFAKLSAPDGVSGGIDVALACAYAAKMGEAGIEAVEVSYGTMDYALNIFRGDIPLERVLKYNRLFNTMPAWVVWLWKRLGYPSMKKHFIPFSEHYNLEAARLIKRATSVPLIVVGGLRRLAAMREILASHDADAVALCRPLIHEPDLMRRFSLGQASESACCNCNQCAVMADHTVSLRCYQPKTKSEPREPTC